MAEIYTNIATEDGNLLVTEADVELITEFVFIPLRTLTVPSKAGIAVPAKGGISVPAKDGTLEA